MIDEQTKEHIKGELAKYVSNIGSQVKAGHALNVSNAYISLILAGKDEQISDDMWRKISKQLGIRLDEKWYHADTVPSKKLMHFFNDARIHGNVFGLYAKPGTGKTDTLDYYFRLQKNVFYVKCERHMTEKGLLQRLLLSMGRPLGAGHVSALLGQIKTQVDKYDCPVIILDEIEKVKPEVMFLFIDLYNLLWKRCGIVLLGTPNLRNRIERGHELGKLGYNEILSRLGGKLIQIPAPNSDDAALVIRSNGITDPSVIQFIINDSQVDGDIDMRRIERLVHAQKQKEADKAA